MASDILFLIEILLVIFFLALPGFLMLSEPKTGEKITGVLWLCLMGWFAHAAYSNYGPHNTSSKSSYSYSGGSRGSSYSGKSSSFQGGRNSGIKSGSYSGGHSSGGNILDGDTGGPGFAVQGSNYGDSTYSSYSTHGYFSLTEKRYCFDNSLYTHKECLGYYDSSAVHIHMNWTDDFESLWFSYFKKNKPIEY